MPTDPDGIGQDIRGALEAYGLPSEPGRFLGMVREALHSVVTQTPIEDAASQLTAGEMRELSGIGLTPQVPGSHQRSLERTAAKMTALLADARTVIETGELLGVTPARVRQMLNEAQPALFGVKVAGSWLVPNFQFVDERPLPNLRPVLGALSRDLHPVEFFNWFTRPDPALRIQDEAVSPQSWLAAGGDPEPVAAEASQL